VSDNKFWYRKGLYDGAPICLGYLAVAFALGIAAKNAGLTALQATVMSATNYTSAGEFAALSLIASGAAYLELAMAQAVINLRYSLMSCALSQKLAQGTTFFYRLFLAAFVTDEIFGVFAGQEGKLNPYYSFGVVSVAAPGWIAGTFLGVLSGNILPAGIFSALGVALYGMFIAIIVPPARTDKTIAVLIVISMALSWVFTAAPLLREISSGFRIIILTLLIAGGAAAVFPLKSEYGQEENHGK
jgi:predicted branched-subunit amino acid permease